MTPKQLLNKLEQEMLNASPDTVDVHTAAYQGALRMYQLYTAKQRLYYETHREHNREYQRNYHKAWRAKKKLQP